MIIRHERFHYSKDTTIGKLYIQNEFVGYTLEDTVRAYGIKVPKYTAIPENRAGYHVGIRYSPGFKRDMVILYTENDYETIKFGGISFKYIYAHGGNTHEDTEGCILCASQVDIEKNTIWSSIEEFIIIHVKKAIDRGEPVSWIVINTGLQK